MIARFIFAVNSFTLVHEKHSQIRLDRDKLGVRPLAMHVGERADVLDLARHFVVFGARKRRSALELAKAKILRAKPAILAALVLAPALDKD